MKQRLQALFLSSLRERIAQRATKKRVEPEWMAPLLKFQQRDKRELTAGKQEAVARRAQAQKSRQVVGSSYTKRIDNCDGILCGMQKILQGMLS